MKINIDEIEHITHLLLSRLKKSKGNEVEINHDYYWDISYEEIYNPYEDPKNMTLGQLSDDIDVLKRLLKSEDDALMYHLQILSNILKVLSLENSTTLL